jgi:hypothetical protein
MYDTAATNRDIRLVFSLKVREGIDKERLGLAQITGRSKERDDFVNTAKQGGHGIRSLRQIGRSELLQFFFFEFSGLPCIK